MLIYSILKAKQRKDHRACILRKKNIQGKNYYGFSPAPPPIFRKQFRKCKHKLSDVFGKRWKTLITNSIEEQEPEPQET
jgi:hypothetical protein